MLLGILSEPGDQDKSSPFSLQILVNEDGTPLECRPCKPCKPGYWNDPEYGQMACMKCRLNCFLMNRKEREPCGESSPGQCGACINRYIVTFGSILVFDIPGSLHLT